MPTCSAQRLDGQELVLVGFYHAATHNGGTMGQRIEIDDVTVIDTSLLVDTNRSLTGTDGEGYNTAEDAAASDTFPAKLAAELFESESAISRVYIDQNVIVLTKPDVWDDETVATVRGVIESFFLFYPDA